MRFVSRFLTVIFVLFVAVAGGLFFYLQNAERLKPDLEAFILEQTGVAVDINGELSWQLFPPLELHMADVRAIDDGVDAHAATLSLRMDLSAMWQDVNSWKVNALQLTETTIKNESGVTELTELSITDFTPGEPAQLFIDGSYLSEKEGESEGENEEPIPAVLEGQVTYFPASDTSPEAIRFTKTHVTSTNVAAVCDIDANENGKSVATLPETSDDLLPINELRTIDLVADCSLKSLTVGTETFTNGSVKVTSMSDNLNVYVEVADFIGGKLFTEVDVNLATQPIRWLVMPELENVDSQRLVDWTDRSVHWIAPLALQGEMQMSGNTEAELFDSIRSEQDFNGGQGEIDITALKAQLSQIAALTKSSDSFAEWPDKWNYQTFTGKLLTRGKQQVLNVQLDNLFIEGDGTYDYLTDKVNMLAHVTFKEAPEGSPYAVNALLQDTPLPVRCRGAASDVSCKLDSGATQDLIAGALRADSDTGLRRKLEEKIDEKVPEEYRETARGILDAIGRALDRD